VKQLLALILLLPATAQGNIGNFDLFSVVRGTPIKQGEAMARSAVKIDLLRGGCTGTLISDRVVITAAHCPDHSFKKVESVTFKPNAHLECGISKVEELAYVPGASRREIGYHLPDLVLIKLATPLCGAKPAHLSEMELEAGNIIQAAGYGKGTDPGNPRPDRLQLQIVPSDEAYLNELYSDLDALSLENLKPMFDRLNGIFSQHFLFALSLDPGTSICHGDSGGPAYMEFAGKAWLLGVNGAVAPHPKKGAPECRNSYLQLITPIAPYKSWIESKISDWEQNSAQILSPSAL